MAKPRIAILFGGCSEEHPVSVKSVREIARHLDPEKYEPYYVGITRDGAWRLCPDAPAADWAGAGRPVLLSPDRTGPALLVLADGRYEPIEVDLVFPVLHGKFGEDGAIQGLLELAGLPYVGCAGPASALAMDKSLAYLVARAAGVATPEFRVLRADETLDPAELTYPVFVKPARSGSSFGVDKVTRAEDLAAAVAEARRYDTKVLIEQAVLGREIGCAVLGDDPDLITGEVDRIALTHGFFRIHQESDPESGSDNATAIVPADVPAASADLVRQTATTVYRALGCRGLSRVDLFLLEDGTVLLNEVNTMPGLTSYSRYPRMMAAAGHSPADVIDQLITLTLTGKLT